MNSLHQDLLHAIRMLARSPAFTAVAVVTLALGIAANAAIFGFMNALLLRPFPLDNLDRLVSVWEKHPQEGSPGGPRGGDQNPLAVADYLDLLADHPGIESLAGYRYRDFVVAEAGEPERVPGYVVTAGYFDALGVRPALGRTFQTQEETPGREAVVVLSHGYWQRRFGADPSILGRSFLLGGRRHEVIGVLPAGLNFPPGAPDLFVPLAFTEEEKGERTKLNLLAVARLHGTVGLPAAQASLDLLSGQLARRYPATNTARSFALVALREMQTGIVAPFLLLFEGAAAFVLLIACANVAGLLIARGASREREIAVRAALGASRSRIVRQLLTEGFVLSTLSAAAGLWMAQAGVDLIRSSLPTDLVRWVAGWSQIRVDSRTLVFTLGLTVVTTLVFALVPALRASRVDLVESLKSGGRGASGPTRRRLRGTLVGFQVALALVLLVGATLVTRGFLGLADHYQGIDPGRVVTFRLELPDSQYPEPRAVASFYQRVVGGLKTTPAIERAAVVSQLPADLGPIPRTSFGIEGRPSSGPQENPTGDLQTISADYLEVIGAPLQRGRALNDGDGAEAPPVALVSASLAERFWPGADPIGSRIRIGDGEPWRRVVGVVADVKQYWFDRDARPTLYVPYLQAPRRDLYLVVKSPLQTSAVVAAARARIREVDRGQPVDEIRTMATVVSESTSFIRLAAALMVILGLVALLLSVVGLYGVVAEHVASRTREIGIRISLGARRSNIMRLIVGQAGRLVAIGLGFGIVVSFGLGRLLARLLFGIVRPDLMSLASVTVSLALVAFLAAWIPARRATRIEPLVALRED